MEMPQLSWGSQRLFDVELATYSPLLIFARFNALPFVEITTVSFSTKPFKLVL